MCHGRKTLHWHEIFRWQVRSWRFLILASKCSLKLFEEYFEEHQPSSSSRGGDDGTADTSSWYSVLPFCYMLLLNPMITALGLQAIFNQKFCSRPSTLRLREKPLLSRSVIIQARRSSSIFLVSGNFLHTSLDRAIWWSCFSRRSVLAWGLSTDTVLRFHSYLDR